MRDNDPGQFQFLDPGELRDGDVILQLAATQPADPVKGWVPCYAFRIMSAKAGDNAGEIQLRIGDTEHLRLYSGHVGYGVRLEYRGGHFAARALRLVMPLALRHGLSALWITCNPENIASRRTCEHAGAAFVEIVDLPPDSDMYLRGDRRKCRYRLDLRLAEYHKLPAELRSVGNDTDGNRSTNC
jgi:predicted acetyltransferase